MAKVEVEVSVEVHHVDGGWTAEWGEFRTEASTLEEATNQLAQLVQAELDEAMARPGIRDKVITLLRTASSEADGGQRFPFKSGF